jgi:hypothetical protein
MRRLVQFAIAVSSVGFGGCSSVNQLIGNTKVSIKMKNGETIEGTVLQNGDGGSTVALSYGTVTVKTGDVESVEKSTPAPAVTPGVGRLSKWDHCLQVLVASRPKGPVVAPIAATVVDKGIFKNVPYQSYRSGDLEFNIYGDPDEPASLEIGLYQKSPSIEARKECLATILKLLNDPADRDTLKSENLDEAKVERAGMTFEVTPSTAEDAYGGWWISVYDTKVVDQQRATEKELAQITVERDQATVKKSDKGVSDLMRWKDHEVKAARPDAAGTLQGRVYLRGVHRKNGVYVALTNP